MNYIRVVYSLSHREMVRFFRQKSRVIGAIVPPLLFWFFIGSGLRGAFTAQEGVAMDYLRFFMPGTLALVVLFTAIFSTISVIEDRREGFLQSVLVAPTPRVAIALGKILGGTAIAFIQGCLFLPLAWVMGIETTPANVVLILGVLFLIAFGLTSLGFLIAWKMDSTQGFHSVMNLFLMPMWFLSGGLFPVQGAPGWLRALMLANPLSYGISALKQGFYPALRVGVMPVLAIGPSLAILTVFCVMMVAVSAWVCRD